MINLYKILFSHTAPKDSKEGIKTYISADNIEQVYAFIDEKYGYGSWKDTEDEGDKFDIYDSGYSVIGTESFKEKMLRISGQMNDEDYDYSDSYYGITLYGWELVKEISALELAVLIDLSVVSESILMSQGGDK